MRNRHQTGSAPGLRTLEHVARMNAQRQRSRFAVRRGARHRALHAFERAGHSVRVRVAAVAMHAKHLR